MCFPYLGVDRTGLTRYTFTHNDDVRYCKVQQFVSYWKTKTGRSSLFPPLVSTTPEAHLRKKSGAPPLYFFVLFQTQLEETDGTIINKQTRNGGRNFSHLESAEKDDWEYGKCHITLEKMRKLNFTNVFVLGQGRASRRPKKTKNNDLDFFISFLFL